MKKKKKLLKKKKKYTKKKRSKAAKKGWKRHKTGLANANAVNNGQFTSAYWSTVFASVDNPEKVLRALNVINSMFPNTELLVHKWFESMLAAGMSLPEAAAYFVENILVIFYYSQNKGADYDSLEDMYSQQHTERGMLGGNGKTLKQLAREFIQKLALSMGYSDSYIKRKWLSGTGR